MIEYGIPVKSRPIVKDIPIMHQDAHYSLRIGTIQLQSDRTSAINSVIGSLLSIFVFLTIVIFCVAFFFFILFNRMVTAHLLDIAWQLDEFSCSGFGTPLRLNRKHKNDELDIVVDAFNEMRENLNSSIKELTNSKELFSRTFFSAPLLMSISSLNEGTYIEVNSAFLAATGFERDEVIGRTSIDIGWVSENDRRRIINELQDFGHVRDMELELMAKNGQKVFCLYAGEIITIDGEERLLSIGLDISEERRLNKERQIIKSKLDQAQKMEAIGRLAGGVAHDFNNKLCVIMGYAELTKMSGKLDQQLLPKIEQILVAAQQSQELTKQLLSFSRKDVVAPKVVDMNSQLRDKLKGLNRLLGEDIEITIRLGDDLWPVLIDLTQLDQIIMNLAVNSRDAMPKGGTIRFVTRNVREDDFRNRCVDCLPGDYVLLQVTDTGNGIPDDLLQNIFEPFFTTKEKHKGTGLGLATVYGIVRQNNGCIDVASEIDKGTTFSIYLPRTTADFSQDELEQEVKIARGDETILLVEDEDGVRSMLKLMLEQAGYAVLEAATPQEAIRLSDEHQYEIDLMLTDVIMPKINGVELAQQITAIRPKMKVLFMSGYAFDVISQSGLMDKGVNFISKPTNLVDLSVKIRSIFESQA